MGRHFSKVGGHDNTGPPQTKKSGGPGPPGSDAYGLTSHSSASTHNRSFSETKLSRKSIPLLLVLTTKDKETKRDVDLHPKHKRETEKTALAKRAIYTLDWYATYGLQLGNGLGPVLAAPKPTWG